MTTNFFIYNYNGSSKDCTMRRALLYIDCGVGVGSAEVRFLILLDFLSTKITRSTHYLYVIDFVDMLGLPHITKLLNISI